MGNKYSWLLISLLVLTGCSVSLEQPLPASAPAGSGQQFIGTWSVTSFVGQSSADEVVISVESGGGENLLASIVGVPSVQNRELHLVSIADRMLAFHFDPETEEWLVIQLDLGASGTSLTIQALDVGQVKEDIDSGVIAGRSVPFDESQEFLVIEADAAALALYLENFPEAFVDFAILEKLN